MHNTNEDKNRRVLVIDDNRAIHDDFRKILSPAAHATAALDATVMALYGSPAESANQTQFKVDSAYQGEEGVLMVQKAIETGLPYAMAFVDVRMPPGSDGVETTRKIWQLDPNLQVVLCTAYSDYSWDEMFAKLGQSDGLLILKKPFDTVEALQLAHALTEKWWLHQQYLRKMEELESRVTERTAELAQTNEVLQVENTERKRAEEKLNIEYAVNRILAKSTSWEQAIREVLQAIGGLMGWDAGMFWATDYRDGVLRCDAVWSAPNIEVDEFKTISQEMTFKRGAGLPGRVWASGHSAWVSDVVEDANFPRAAAAKQAGLHGAFAFAILIENRTVGVVEFFSHEVRAPESDLLQSFTNVGNQLGQFFNRKRLEMHLFQSQRLETVGKLAGGVAHEFNSILTAIIGQSELLLGDLPRQSPLTKNATEIHKAAMRAVTLTRQLLAYGRKQMLQPKTIDLNLVLTGMESTLQHLMGRDVDVHIALAPGLKAVKIDLGQIEQVIVNIAMNAAAVMPNGGKLTLETANVKLDQEYVNDFPDLKAGEYVMLAITDTGTGISPEAKKHIFEPFSSIKGVGQGTGLGLATCYGILKQSGAHINVYSELSRGATFKIYLPQVELAAKIPAPPLIAPALPRGTETILLVEDDPALREMAATLLRRLGYTVSATADGLEALNLKHQPGAGHMDLLFTDVVLPHMGGKELADRVQSLYPRTKILFTSAYTENAIVHQGVLNKGVAILQKPFTPGELARKVRDILDQSDASQPLVHVK
jgi:two-component system cell cycle sensor histidine kinase/response regulator CckA